LETPTVSCYTFRVPSTTTPSHRVDENAKRSFFTHSSLQTMLRGLSTIRYLEVAASPQSLLCSLHLSTLSHALHTIQVFRSFPIVIVPTQITSFKLQV
jgi:hypothetical protein